jgi:hypothetical protein
MQRAPFMNYLKSIAIIAALSVGFVLPPIDRSSISAIEGQQSISLDISSYNYDYKTEKLIVFFSNNSAIVWQTEVITSRQVRAEIFDPISGHIISNNIIDTQNIQNDYLVGIPTNISFDEIEVIAENLSGERRRLEVISSSSSELLDQSPGKENSQSKIESSTLTTILNNGQSDNRIDILLLGDGYLESELAQWEIDAEAAVTSFLSVEPYSSYAQYFNAHRINTPSNVSGASHPENNDTRDTAFGAYYNCQGTQRLICANDSAVNTVVQSLTVPTQADIVLLIVNDSEYGGSGGAIAVASTNSAATGLILHETGHSFGLLADEYDSALPDTPSDCGSTTITNEPNVSGLVNLDMVKWKHWLPTSVTDIPTPYTLDVSDPGFYRGSKYCNELYRPTPNSMMRSLGRPFDAINEEALMLRIYDFVSPVDSFSPSTSSVTISANQSTAFSVTTLRPKFHELQTKWYVNDQEVMSGASFNSNLLNDGNQTLKVVVSDTTTKVILDPSKKLIFEQVWQISNSIDLTRSAYIEGNVIYAPFVRIQGDSGLFNIELAITSTSPYQFTLQAAEARNSDLQPSNSSSFSGNILTLNNLMLDGVSYTVNLQLQTTTPAILFELLSATAD